MRHARKEKREKRKEKREKRKKISVLAAGEWRFDDVGDVEDVALNGMCSTQEQQQQ